MSADPGEISAAEFERVREAVIYTVAEHSYADSTLAMVLDRAGVDAEAFHRHYVDLEDACCLAYQDLSLEFIQTLAGAFADTESWVEQIRAVAVALYHYILEDMDRARFIYVEFPLVGRRARALRDRTMRSLIALVDQGRYQLDDPEEVSRATAEAITGAIYNRLREGISVGDVKAARLIAAETIYMAIQPYLGPEIATDVMNRPIE